MTTYDPAAARAEAAGWGPFFAVRTHASGAAPPPPWRPLRELFEDPDVLGDRVARVRAYLAAANGRDPADVRTRVAASVTQMGITARLLSPALAAVILTGRAPDLAGAWWQPELGGAFPLSLTGGSTPGGIAAILDGPVRQLVDATRAFSVPDRVLWGNTASAVNGAATMIGQARPDLAAPAHDLAVRVLAEPPLRHTGDHRDGTFRRRSCCLIYQAAPPAAPRSLCGDCVLTPPAG